MEDYVLQVRRYLPIRFANDEANDFLKYLEEACLENARNQKYQFAFVAFHMLYMTFCYKIKWFLKTQNNKKVNQSLQEYISKNKGVFFNVLFDLSRFPEKETFECLLSSLQGFNSNDLDNCKIHVTKRNHCAHASGKIEYKEKDIEYIDWFVENNVSRKDLEIIVGFKVPLLRDKSDNEVTVFQKILYLVFINETGKYIDTEKNLFVERLPMFMIGLKSEIKIRRNGEEKTISMREVIEDNLVPIISEFPSVDREKAEKILKL